MTTYEITWIKDDEQYAELFTELEEAKKFLRNVKRRKGVEQVELNELEGEDEDGRTEQFDAPVADDETESEGDATLNAEGWVTFTQAAVILGVRYQQVFQKAKQGKIAKERIQGRLWTRRDDVDAWMDRRMKYLASRDS